MVTQKQVDSYCVYPTNCLYCDSTNVEKTTEWDEVETCHVEAIMHCPDCDSSWYVHLYPRMIQPFREYGQNVECYTA